MYNRFFIENNLEDRIVNSKLKDLNPIDTTE